jgi:hypothetical protein
MARNNSQLKIKPIAYRCQASAQTTLCSMLAESGCYLGMR